MISYCITVYNEIEYIKKLLNKIYTCKTTDEEVVVVQTYRDITEKDSQIFQDIQSIILSYPNVIYHTYHFENNFAELKNYMGGFATKPYIFNLDADEDFEDNGFPAIRDMLNQSDTYDVYFLPRINIVEGLTQEDIKKWNWVVNENGWINWPDFQSRIYKNDPAIKWSGSVHEKIIGNKNRAVVEPKHTQVAILHTKTIDRQRSQNDHYDAIVNKSGNKPITISSCRTLIGLCSWNNPMLLSWCVDSLLHSIDLSQDRIAVVLNEGDEQSISYLHKNKIPFIYNPENSGPLAIDFLKGYIERSEYFINSNDDMIFHPGFVEDLISIIESNYPATASCGLVENFNSNNPAVIVNTDLSTFDENSVKLFFTRYMEGRYLRPQLTFGYGHPIMCKSQDLLNVGGYSGNWDMDFLSGYGRDDAFPYLLWKNSGGKYKFIMSDKSVVFHLSSFTNKKLPTEYRQQNHNQDKFSKLSNMSLYEFRNKIIKIGQPAL
jgi:hypothetical protein